MALAALVQDLEHRRLINYIYISAVAIYIYDYFLTLRLEIKWIWFSKWSYTKILFLVVRYITFVVFGLMLHTQMFSNPSVEMCKVTYPLGSWLGMVQIFLAEVILATRTWAVWWRNKIVGVGIVALTAAHIVVQCVLMSRLISPDKFVPPPYSAASGCFLSDVRKNLWEMFTALIVVEAVVFVLMVISAVQSHRRGKFSKFSCVVYRDGIIFYFYLLCISAASLVVTIALPLDTTILLNPMQNTLYALLTTRIIINMRDVSSRGTCVELHTGYYDSFASVKPSMSSISLGTATRWTVVPV